MQFDFFDVPSPCKGICTTDEKGYCLGCMRTRDERFNWNSLDANQKQKVIKLCRQREKRKQAKLNPIAESNNQPQPEIEVRQPSLLDDKPANKSPEIDLDFTDFEL